MKVLVITRNAWDDTNSIGNTMSSFFGSLRDIELANIYFRPSQPNNKLCTRYFRVSEYDVARNWFSPERCGKAFDYCYTPAASTGYSKEKRAISAIHRLGIKSVYRLSDKLWDSKKWINRRLDDFVEEFNPAVVFTFVKAAPQYYLTIRHLHEKHGLKIYLWIADDEYTEFSLNKSKRNTDRINRLKFELGCADKVWGCSEEICGYYNSIFGCSASPLYKSCVFKYPVRAKINRPLRLMYAGNLLFGRFEILKKVIAQLQKLNSTGLMAKLNVYSSTPVPQPELDALQKDGSVSFPGVKPYDEIQAEAARSDLIIHIESFGEEEKNKTRYSFSTKIIDCLQSGSALLAIGPPDIASIRYVRQIPGAFVIDDENKLEQQFAEIISDDTLPERASKIRDFAEGHHSPDSSWLT